MPSNEFWLNLKDWDIPKMIFAFAVIALFIGFFAARHFLKGGKDTFESEQEDKKNAIAILEATNKRLASEKNEVQRLLEGQIEELKTKLGALEQKVELMANNEVYNREYRHALANQNQIFIGNYQNSLDLLADIQTAWVDMPAYWKSRIARQKTAEELMKSCPLPAAQ